MNREQSIKALKELGAEIAKELGYDTVIYEKRGAGPLWDSINLMEKIEAQHGDCSSCVRFVRSDMPKNQEYGDEVTFEFRFSSPKLLIDKRKTPEGTLASIELSDWNSDNSAIIDKEMEKLGLKYGDDGYLKKRNELEEKYPLYTNNFSISESQVFFGHHGDTSTALGYLNRLINGWEAKKNQNIITGDEA